MKNNFGQIALAMLLLCCSVISINAATNKGKQLIQLNNSFCKSIGKKPVITVCVSGNPGQEEEFNENTLKSLKSSTKSLVSKYKKSQKFVNAKFSVTGCGSQCTYSDWDPATCGGSSYCAVHTTDPMCGYTPPPPPPPNPPVNCGSDCYCYMMNGQAPPSSLNCPSNPSPPTPPPPAATCTGPYDWGANCDPTGQNRTFCQMYPSDPMYCATQSSACTYGNWDPNLCGAPTYCHAFPNQPPNCVGLP